MNRIRLEAGQYLAISEVTVAVFFGEQEKEYTEYKAGDTFCVPKHRVHHWSAAVYHPDFGDPAPEFERVE